MARASVTKRGNCNANTTSMTAWVENVVKLIRAALPCRRIPRDNLRHLFAYTRDIEIQVLNKLDVQT